MKVLFAVSNDNISTQIVKRYQKEYKEIISYKNVYYFNAIVKELQRDKSYDRIVISEDLEPFANNNNDAIEKFIFEKLDNISDEATGINGKDIPIILLATDKRRKSDPILVKLFGIGIYDALLGQERTTDQVAKLLKQPRTKKDAKIYYKIESEEVSYKSENENNVSETEIKNILNHYRKLGKDEERYIESFNNIAEQYNDAQLRIITKFLPLNVKAVLEERSPKYQSVMTFTENASTSELMKVKKEEEGLRVGFLNYNNSSRISEPVIVPTAVKKVAMKKGEHALKNEEELNEEDEFSNIKEDTTLPGFDEILDITEEENKQEIAEPIKRGRGRPKKISNESETEKVNVIKRGRGRPKKEAEEGLSLPGFEDVEETMPEMNINDIQDTTLPGFEDVENIDDAILPGFDEVDISNESDTLPGFDEIETSDEITTLPSVGEDNQNYNNISNISTLLSKDKKIVSFVGTTKNGTSFIVNNVAKCLSSMGIKTAILDLTSNKDSFYIYTKNEEGLRQVAYESIEKLKNGIKSGISVDKNLDVYTSLPGNTMPLTDVNEIMSTLVQNYSVILMDCDFNTPTPYFEVAQEIYVVQTMDIFTIQPMTAFLRELKAKEVLNDGKIRIVINKAMNMRKLTPKIIIGGLSNYNDPTMSFMTELFNRDNVKYFIMPFDAKVWETYLEGVMDCEVTINNYPKAFVEKIKDLSNMIYPLLESKEKKNSYFGNEFSTDMNNTLEQMKNRY